MDGDAGFYQYEQDAGMFAGDMRDSYQDAEYALEDNGLHMTAFGAQGNPRAQDKHTITRGWEKFAFPKAVRLLRETDLKLQQKALLTISELLSTGEACVQLINAGVVVALTECLGAEDETVRERAAADLEILIGVAGAKGCNQMLEDGAVEKLLSLLDDSSAAVRNAVYNALVEGCMRSAAIQARLCSTEGTLEGLLAKAGEEDPERVACALELIRVCLAGRNPGAADQLLRVGALATLVQIMDKDDAAVVEGATMVLGLLCVEWDAKAEAVKAKAVPALVDLMGKHEQLSTKIVAVAALMNICVDTAGKAASVEDGAVPLLAEALEVDDEKLVLNSLQCIASIAENKAGRALLQPLAPRLAELMHHHVTVIQRHAMLAMRAVEFKELGK